MAGIYPFKFLDSYSSNDTCLFFGRDEEVSNLYQMVFQSNILMVYGASGTGKTSLIQCGLASRFQPHDWLALYIRRGSDLNASFAKAIAEAGDITGTADLEKTFKAIYRNSFRPVYLIFDQFEELFILGTKEEQAQFIKTVKAILNIEQPVKMVFSMREEYLGSLYYFEKEVPQLTRKKLRVEAMSFDKVQQVITGTTGEGSLIGLKNGEENLIITGIYEKVLGKDKYGKPKTGPIQLPYLQVFLDKLYMTITHDEQHETEAVFSIDAIAAMGDIDDILRDFLEEQVKKVSGALSKETASVPVDCIWDVLSQFVTLEGTKVPMTMQTLQSRLPGTDNQLIQAIIAAFVTGRILRYAEEEDIYELAHDALAGKIASKRSDEEIALVGIERLIKSQVALKEDARELFTQKQVNIIDLYWDKLLPRLNDDDKAFVAKSKEAIKARIEADEQKALEEANAEEQEKAAKEHKRKILRREIFVAMMAGILFLTGTAIWLRERKIKAQSLAISSQAVTEIYKNNNITKAFKYAQYAFEKDHSNLNAVEAIYSTIFQSNDEPVKLFYTAINTSDYNDSRIACSQDGNKLLCFDSVSLIKIINVFNETQRILIKDNNIRNVIKTHSDTYGSLTYHFSPAGNILYITCRENNADSEYVFNANNGSKYFETANAGLYFSPTENNILLYQDNDNISVFDVPNGKFSGKIHLQAETGMQRSVRFSNDGAFVSVHTRNKQDNIISVFKTDTLRELKQIIVNKDDSVYFSFSDNSRQLAVGNGTGKHDIYDLPGMNKVRSDGSINVASFCSKRLMYDWKRTWAGFGKRGTKNGIDSLTVVDFITGNKIVISGARRSVNDFCFAKAFLSADGERILTRTGTLGPNGKLRTNTYPLTLWNAKTGEKIVDIYDDGQSKSGNNNIDLFSPDGKFFMTSNVEKNAKLWNAGTGLQIAVLGEKSIINKAVFSKDSKYIVTSSADSFAKVWSLTRILDPSALSNRADATIKLKWPESRTETDFEKINKADRNFSKSYDPADNSFIVFENQHKAAPDKSESKTVKLSEEKKLRAFVASMVISVANRPVYTYSVYGSEFLLRIRITPDGKYLLGTFGNQISSGTIQRVNPLYSTLWDIGKCREIGTFDVIDGLFSSDSKLLFARESNDKNQHKLIDLASGTELAEIYMPDDSIANFGPIHPQFSFSDDDKMLLAKYKYGDDSIMKAWLLDPAQIIKKLKNTMPDLSPDEKEKYGISD